MTAEELRDHPEITVEQLQDIIENYSDVAISSFPWLWILLATLVLVSLVVMIARKWRRRKSRTKPLNPEHVFKQMLAQIAGVQEVREFYVCARGAVNAYVYWKSGRPVESLTDEELGRLISDREESRVLAPIVARHTQAVFAGEDIPESVRCSDLECLRRLGAFK